MTFEDKKLSEFLALLISAEQYQTAPPDQSRHVLLRFIDLTNQVAELYTNVQKELKKNIVLSDNPMQQDGVKKMYFEELVTGFAKYYKCYYWISKNAERIKYKDKNRLTITLPELENEIPKEEIAELKWNIDKIEKSIAALNPDVAIEVATTKDKLSHKQQILLLKQLGFFELPIFQKLTTKQKGKLVSHLINRTEKDSLELIRGMNGKTVKPYIIKTKVNTETVNKLLSELCLKEHLVK